MDLPDLREFLAPETLVLRIAGIEYEIQPCTALEWAAMQTLRADMLAMSEKREPSRTYLNEDVWKTALRDVADVMLGNGVRGSEVTRSAMTAYYWHLGLEDAAKLVWSGSDSSESDEDADEGKALAPVATKTRTTRSPRSAGATTTRSRASMSGTKTSRKR